MKTANYEIITNSNDAVYIRDVGPWDQHPTVTNDVEGVVKRLFASGYLKSNNKQLFYYDSEKRLDEIIHKNGQFVDFRPLPQTKFHYESDGERSCPTFYVIAENDAWADCKRLDFGKKKTAQDVARQLKAGTLTMDEAAYIADEKWL